MGRLMARDPSEMAGTQRARRLLSQSEKAVEDMLIVFDSMAERMRAGEVSESDVVKVLTAYTRARNRLIEEVVKNENGVLVDRKQVAHAPLDFDELRRGIGRKLDRIRNA